MRLEGFRWLPYLRPAREVIKVPKGPGMPGVTGKLKYG